MEDSEVKVEASAEQRAGESEGAGGVTEPAAQSEHEALTEEDIAFAAWALQLGGYLRGLLETDPSAAAQELEAAAQHLRQLTQMSASPAPEEKGSAGTESARRSGESPTGLQESPEALKPESLEEVVRAAVERALAEKMKQVLASPPSLHGSPVSGRRLADLIE